VRLTSVSAGVGDPGGSLFLRMSEIHCWSHACTDSCRAGVTVEGDDGRVPARPRLPQRESPEIVTFLTNAIVN